MKKVFLFLSIIMFAFTGVLFACGEDRYADLKISVTSVTYGDTNSPVTYVKEGGYYEVIYGQNFTVTATTSCSNDISHAVLFDSLSDTSVNYISKQDTSSGSRAVFKAAAPSYDNLFRINLRSVETSKNSTSIYVRVLLPVASISLNENLALTSGYSLDLAEYTTYTSKPQSSFETNEKGVIYELKSFLPFGATEATSLVGTQSDKGIIYSRKDKPKAAFKLQNGVVEVLDKTLEGDLYVAATSIKFDAAFEEECKQIIADHRQLTQEQKQKREENNRLRVGEDNKLKIRVAKGISLDDISFAGGQIGFDSSKSKLDASLYINSKGATYKVDGKDFLYHAEQLNFTVATKESVSLKAEIGSIFDDNNNEILSDANVVKIENGDNLELTPEYTDGVVTKQSAKVIINTTGGSGSAYVDFIITFSGFSNKISYRFSELYKEYLNKLIKEEKELGEFDLNNSKLNICASVLPSDIVILQDGEKVNPSGKAIKIFDTYSTQGNNFSEFGTKIYPQLILDSGLTSSKIEDLNKGIRVYVSASGNVNVTEYLEVRDDKNRIPLCVTTRGDENNKYTAYYFDLDLSSEATSYFYVKAIKGNLANNAEFNFEFENQLKSTIKDVNGNVIEPNTDKSKLKNKSVTIKAKTVKGVEGIAALVNNSSNYYRVDDKNLDPNPLYQQVVLNKISSKATATQDLGTILGIFVNAGVDGSELLNIYVENEEYTQVFRNVSNTKSVFESWTGDTDHSIDEEGNSIEVTVNQFHEGISVVGKKVGTTTLYIQSENGYMVTVKIKVVNEINRDTVADNFKLEIKQNYGSEIVTENTLNQPEESNPYISAKVNGIFNIAYSIILDESGVSDDTGVVNIEYLVYKKGTWNVVGVTPEHSNIVTINQKTGLVSTNTTGQATIVVKMTYYTFGSANGVRVWSSAECVKSFDITVYEPATSIRLERYSFEEGLVYDRNSLGIEYIEKSNVVIRVIISPSSATIANDSTAIKFTLPAGNKNLVGANGVYTAYLLEGQKKAVVHVTVTVTEFGYTADLDCEVVITRATQVESINYTAFDGDNQKPNQQMAGDNNYDYISTKKGRTLRFNTSIYPAQNKVYVDDLVVTIFQADDPTSNTPKLTLNGFGATDKKAELAYGAGSPQQRIILQSGVDSFNLNISNDQSGAFFVVIFARDSMTSATAGKVVRIICVKIEDGSVDNPFVVTTLNELLEINDSPSSHYILGANINLGSIANWTPLVELTGSLNGYNVNVGKFFTISGLKINQANSENVGLFSAIGKTDKVSIGAVLNLKLVVSYIRINKNGINGLKNINLGSIAGVNQGVIYNCSVDAQAIELNLSECKNFPANIGGVVGLNKGGIYNVPISYKLSKSIPQLSTSDYSNGSVISKSLISDDITNVNPISDADLNDPYEVLEKFCVSTNPVNVNMVVNDSDTSIVNIGGIAGEQQGGFINGIYGVYNYIEEKLISGAGANAVNYLTVYQSQGVDVVANINTTDGQIKNSESKIGGVVGSVNNGYVANVSASGQIGRYDGSDISGANNYVGGIVGQSASSSLISNVSANVKLRANSYVGGVVGYADDSNIKHARVESYQDNSQSVDAETLIIANNNVGGVAGGINGSIMSYAYSYSYIDDLNDTYRQMGDIYLTGNTPVNTLACVGGIAGYIGGVDLHGDSKVVFQQLYSTFNIITSATDANMGGLVGSISDHKAKLLLSNVFYVGVLQAGADSTISALAPSDIDPEKYHYYYLLKYEELADGSYALSFNKNDYGSGGSLNSNYTEDKYDLAKYSIVESGVVTGVGIIKENVILYPSISEIGNFSFIRSIPEAISVGTNKSNVYSIEDNTLALDDYHSTSKKYFYSYIDNGVLHVVGLYNSRNNEYKLNNLFDINPVPSIVGRLNILVQSSNNQVASVTNEGDLIINGLGRALITFRVRENASNSASQTVVIDIVENIDKLLVSNSLSFDDNLLENDAVGNEKVISIRKNTAVNLFGLFGEYVENPSSSVVYGDRVDGLSLIQIANTTGYSLDYKVYDSNNKNLVVSGYTISNKSISFEEAGIYYYVRLVITFELDGEIFSLTNDNWKVKINVYEGATYIKFDTTQTWIAGNETKTVDVIISSDAESVSVNDLFIYLNDEDNKFVYNPDPDPINYKNGLVGDDVVRITYVENSYKKVDTTHSFTFNVFVNKKYRHQTSTIDYKLYAYDTNLVLINSKAELTITVAPQGVAGITGVHYAYTQSVSKVEANVNTGASPENQNYSYSFTNEPKDSVVAGGEGLFAIDLYPYYSDIKSVTVHSSLGTSGNALQFVQLVKIKNEVGTDSYSYIYAPQTQATVEGGIALNLYSYVDTKKAELSYYEATKVYTVNHKDGVKSLANKYRFDDMISGSSDGSELGRLYLKTVAPTNINEEESFIVYVTVNYVALNENHELVEMQKVYEHKLVVESMPGFSLSISHEGNERNVIAYTDEDSVADYLDILPLVSEGYSYESINAELFETSTNENLEIIQSQGQNATGYILLNNISGGSRLMLGTQAKVGDTILIYVKLNISLGGYIQTRFYTTQIKVVDVVIESVSVEGLDGDNNLKLTVSTSKQLKVKINGFGTTAAITQAENKISRSISYQNNSINYWFAKSSNSNEYYVNLDSVNIKNSLPFLINKVTISNEKTSIVVDGNAVGASKAQGEMEVSTLPKLVVLEGSTSSGHVEMLLRFSYVYLDSKYEQGDYKVSKGQIVFVPNAFSTSFVQEKYFTLVVTEDSNEDNPTPIYDEEGLLKMSNTKGGDFILMNDITIKNHTALKAEFGSFDGNNKIITIQSFAYSSNLGSSNSSYSINMGLFDTISTETIVKNVIVALPADKRVAMDLTGYTTINFGGIAAVNSGVITNCDVISVTTSSYNLDSYLAAIADSVANYTLNIETSDTIGSNNVSANIGLLVGQNTGSGFITNSRVGRESVEILSVRDSESTVVYKSTYSLTAPVMLVKIYGRANIGGFVADNAGTISSSYTKNIQLEVISKSSTEFVKTGGFVVTNRGFIHGSYVAGWEEDDLVAAGGYATSANRKLGGGIYSNGFIGGFVYSNQRFIEDAYSNINISGSLTFAAKSNYISFLKTSDWVSPAVGGFVYISTQGSEITTSYSLSKITTKDTSSRSNTHGAFEGRLEAPDDEFDNSGEITNSYFMQEKDEEFSYEHERAIKLTDDPAIDLGNSQTASGQNEFIQPGSFNNFSFDNSLENFSDYTGESMGGVWAIYKPDGIHGYPELISANTIAISSRVINVTKTNASETNKYYYTYVDGYEIGSTKNPYLVSNFQQYNNIFKDTANALSFNKNVSTKFTGNIRLIKHIDFENSEKVYSTSVEYTSLVDLTSIFDGNYLAMYNITLISSNGDSNEGASDERDLPASFGLFKDVYYAGIKNLTLGIDKVAGNETMVGALAGAIINSNISNITLVSANTSSNSITGGEDDSAIGLGVVSGNNYVGALAGIVVSNDEKINFTVSNIKSNLSIIGSVSTGSTTTAIKNSKSIWETIKPTATSSGLSEINANLRLHKMPNNVYYAGGIAGVIDLHQIDDGTGKIEVTTNNAYNIHVGEFTPNTNVEGVKYNTNVSIISDYSGGLFGMVGVNTYLEKSEFIANNESAEHFISAREIAGGIAAVNFGKISQCYVSFAKDTTNTLNKGLVEYLTDANSSVNTHLNTTLFASGSPKYIGGIAGINAGSGIYGSGHIIDCYNRVDVRNTNAIGVGGIVGGSYIGQISNVYTTASLLGNLQNDETKIGAILGKIFYTAKDLEGTGGYFVGIQEDNAGAMDNLNLLNIVALNLWLEEDFNALYQFAQYNSIGALYGEFDNTVGHNGDENDTFVKIDASSGIFVQNYAIKNFHDQKLLNHDFTVGPPENSDACFELWGTSKRVSSPNYDDFLAQFFAVGQSNESLITLNDYKALFSVKEGGGVSPLRDTYFPSVKWSRAIWNYDNDKLLPVLEYGYETSVIRIYTAEQFKTELSSGTTSGKFYVIMNDIDFGGIDITPIVQTFRGHLYGNNVTYIDGTYEYTRKPILFNLTIDSTTDADGNPREGEPNAKYAIFTDSHGAVFENFNIVLKEFKVDFKETADEKVASVLVANSADVTINNVHIYSSLITPINEEIVEGNYKFESGVAPYVTKGTYYDSDNNVLKFSNPFLKVAALDNTVGKTVYEVESFEPIELYYTLSDGNFIPYQYVDPDGGVHTTIDGQALVNSDKISSRSVSTEDGKINIKNANFVGLLTGKSSLSYIAHSSVNVENFKVEYSKLKNTSLAVYVGAMIGQNVGEVRNVAGTAKINIKVPTTGDKSFGAAYVGGLVGCHNGIVNHAYAKSLELLIGQEDNPITGTTGHEGIFVGGAFGAIDRYTTKNEAVVGGTDFLYVVDSKITACSMGVTKIGGAIGQNSFTIGDVYNSQTLLSKQDEPHTALINVVAYNVSADYLVGGLIGFNNASLVANAFTNVSIDVKVKSCATEEEGAYTLKVGGIFAHCNVKVEVNNAVNDAEFINIDTTTLKKTTYKTRTLYVGGITAHVQGVSSTLALYNVLSSVDIKSNQQEVMYVGGAVGSAEGGLAVSSGVILGNIYLDRASVAPEGTLFFKDSEAHLHRIGGLAGYVSSEKGFTQVNANVNIREQCKFIVLSTIRDYAIAQKTNLEIGPVIGSKIDNEKVDVKSNLLQYCEAIALVSNNGYDIHKFKNVSQVGDTYESYNLLYEATEAYERLLKEFDGIAQYDIHNNDGLYSRTNELYFKVFGFDNALDYVNGFKDGNPIYTEYLGSKLTPEDFVSTLENDKYYVLTANLENTISTEATNWVLNAQGYLTNVYPAFSSITHGSAVVGLLANSQTGQSAAIATNNYGFIFSCGVAGKIKIDGAYAASSIVNGNYGVISSSFSIADLYGKAASGIAAINGDSTHIGNIYSSYYSGSIMPTATGGNFVGIANESQYGTISNCYTMADIDTTVYNINAYPITATSEANTFKVFYDYVAYTGANEGLSMDEARESAYITSKGIYVWSSTLTGKSNIDLKALLEGGWLKPGDITDLKSLFMMSSLYDSVRDGVLDKLDTAWFNYGYATNNFVNILVGPDNITNYFIMLYTGNGLASREDAAAAPDPLPAPEEDPYYTYGLLNQPYKVKHAGILDVLVSGNNKGSITYKYYLFTKNIDFIKYSGLTYWSKTWDDDGITFVGDLDGYKDDSSNYKVLNMFSSYGLVRAMPESSDPQGRITTVRNMIIKDSYSKTGLVAGYTGSNTKITNVAVEDCLVYNGDISSITKSIFAGKGYGFVTIDSDEHNMYTANVENNGYFGKRNFNRMSYKGSADGLANVTENENFAGGLIGYMNGGTIESSCSLTNTYVLASDINYDVETQQILGRVKTYVGGLVGYMISGKIGADSDADPDTHDEVWDFGQDLTVANVASLANINSYVGGIAGYVSASVHDAAIIQNIKINNVKLNGSYAIGGIAGRLRDGILQNNIYSNGLVITVQNSTVKNGASEYEIVSNSLNEVAAVYAGGIAGVADGFGSITNCQLESQIELGFDSNITPKEDQVTLVALGGIVGQLNGSTITTCVNNNHLSQNTSLFSQRIIGGIAGIMNAGTITGESGKETVSSGDVGGDTNNISGGIVGKLTNGKVEYCSVNGGLVKSNEMAAGIAGFIDVEVDNPGFNMVIVQNSVTKVGATVEAKQYAGGLIGKIATAVALTGSKTEDGYNCVVSACKNEAAVTTTNTAGNDDVVDGDYSSIYGVAGGVVGYATGTTQDGFYSILIDQGENAGKISTNNSFCNLSIAGGITGFASFVNISGNSKNTGEVTNAYLAGGIVAYGQNITIANVNSNSTVTATAVAGGIAGLLEGSSFLQLSISTGENSRISTITAASGGGISGGIIAYANGVSINAGTQILTSKKGYVEGFVSGGVVGYVNEFINNSESIGNASIVIASGNKGFPLNKKYLFELNVLKLTDTNEEHLSSASIPDVASAGGIMGVIAQNITFEKETINKGVVSASTGGIAGGIIGQVIDGNTKVFVATNKGTVGLYDPDITVDGDEIKASVAGGIIGIAGSKVVIGDGEEPIIDPDTGEPIIKMINIENAEKDDDNKEVIIFAANFAGGIAGKLEGGKILGNSTYRVTNKGNVETAHNITSGAANGGAGGIAGYIQDGTAIIDYITNTGSVTGNNSHAGGVVGYMIGGMVGPKEITFDIENDIFTNIENNQIAGEITSSNNNAGGVIGFMEGGTLSYNKWIIPTDHNLVITAKHAGGLVGYQNATSAKILGDIGAIGAKGTSGNKIEGTLYAGGMVGLMQAGIIENVEKKITKPQLDDDGNQMFDEDGLPIMHEVTKNLESKGGKINVNNAPQAIYGGGLVGYMIDGEVKGGAGGDVYVRSQGEFPSYGGGLVGYMMGGKVVGGKFSGTVNAGNSAGGVVGYLNGGTLGGQKAGGSLVNIYVGADASAGTVSGATNRGGLVGYMTGSSLINYGNGSDISGGTNAGGIVGYMDNGTVKTGCSGGKISGATNAGGVAGKMEGGEILGGSSTSVSGTHAGGIVGSLISGVVVGGGRGTVTGTTNAGGIVGSMSGGTVSGGRSGAVKATGGSSNAGSVVGTITGGQIDGGGGGDVDGGTNAGGIAGKASGGTIACNPEGNVKGKNAGGIVGLVAGTFTVATNEIKCPSIEGEEIVSAMFAKIEDDLEGEIGLINNIKISIEDSKNIKTIKEEADKRPGAYLVPTNTITIAGTSSASPITITLNAASSMSLVNINEEDAVIANIKVAMEGEGNSFTGKACAEVLDTGKALGVIADYNKGYIYNCENAVSVISVTSDISFFGGIAGHNNGGNISSCKNTGTIEAEASRIGGIVGTTTGESGTIAECTNSANIINSGSAGYMGGICGYCEDSKVNGTNTGNITGNEAGTDLTTKRDGGESNLFNKVTTTPTTYVGGIAGAVKGGTAVVEGTNEGKIKNLAKYVSSASSATIDDRRGQIVGARYDEKPTIKNLDGHTTLNGVPQTKDYGNSEYVVFTYQLEYYAATCSCEDDRPYSDPSQVESFIKSKYWDKGRTAAFRWITKQDESWVNSRLSKTLTQSQAISMWGDTTTEGNLGQSGGSGATSINGETGKKVDLLVAKLVSGYVQITEFPSRDGTDSQWLYDIIRSKYTNTWAYFSEYRTEKTPKDEFESFNPHAYFIAETLSSDTAWSNFTDIDSYSKAQILAKYTEYRDGNWDLVAKKAFGVRAGWGDAVLNMVYEAKPYTLSNATENTSGLQDCGGTASAATGDLTAETTKIDGYSDSETAAMNASQQSLEIIALDRLYKLCGKGCRDTDGDGKLYEPEDSSTKDPQDTLLPKSEVKKTEKKLAGTHTFAGTVGGAGEFDAGSTALPTFSRGANTYDLVQWAWHAQKNHWGYCFGTSGQIMTQALYDSWLYQYAGSPYDEDAGTCRTDDALENWEGQRVADCSGLIYGYANLDCVRAISGSPAYGHGAGLQYNAAIIKGAKGSKGNLESYDALKNIELCEGIPDIPGVCVSYESNSHIGIYVGNGWVIHASGTDTGVILDKFVSSSWTKWSIMAGMDIYDAEGNLLMEQ